MPDPVVIDLTDTEPSQSSTEESGIVGGETLARVADEVPPQPASDKDEAEASSDDTIFSELLKEEISTEVEEPLKQKNLASLLVTERQAHEKTHHYELEDLDALDLIGSEKDQVQSEANKLVRELLRARPTPDSPVDGGTAWSIISKVTHEAPAAGQVLKLNDGSDMLFDELPVWMQFSIETSPSSIGLSTRLKRMEAYSARVKELGFFERLHEEIIGVLGWLEPSDIEIELRRRAIARVEHVARTLWPDCTCTVFGSVASGLSLPTGDIDLNITGLPPENNQSDKVNLRLLSTHLLQWKLVRAMEVVLGAKVPIIKGVDSVTEYPLDITLNQTSSSETTRFLKRQLRLHPHLRPLILVLKVYLQQRNLAETYHGGIGSYLLFCMCLGFLQQHVSSSNPAVFASLSLGHLLFDFFQFYGYDHAYATMGISVRNGGELYLKKAKGFFRNERPYLLSIQSPLDPTVDVGANSYNIPIIRDAFKKTYARLSYMFKLWSSDGSISPTESILKEVLWPKDVLFSRKLPYEAIRESLRHYEASGGDDRDPAFTLWLKKGTDWRGIAPYPSRIKHISQPRPTMSVDDALRKETDMHFRQYFKMVVRLRQLRRDALVKHRKRSEKIEAEAEASKKRQRSDTESRKGVKRSKTDDGTSRKVEVAAKKNEDTVAPLAVKDLVHSGKVAEDVPPLSNIVVTKGRKRFEPLLCFLGGAVENEDGDNLDLSRNSKPQNVRRRQVSNEWSD